MAYVVRPGAAYDGVGRRDVDDLSSAALEHVATHGLGHEEGALQVGVNDPVPGFLGHVLGRLVHLGARIVDEDVHAPVTCEYVGDEEARSSLAVLDVEKMGRCRASGSLDVGCQPLDFLAAAGGCRDRGARLSQPFRDVVTDPAPGTCDDSDPAAVTSKREPADAASIY